MLGCFLHYAAPGRLLQQSFCHHHAQNQVAARYAAAWLAAIWACMLSADTHYGVLLQFMGIVEDVGEQVKNVKKGNRVVAAFDLGCGGCMCANSVLHERMSSPTIADATNRSVLPAQAASLHLMSNCLCSLYMEARRFKGYC
jgi:Alcohol dehydrogenase GroES-like domain